MHFVLNVYAWVPLHLTVPSAKCTLSALTRSLDSKTLASSVLVLQCV